MLTSRKITDIADSDKCNPDKSGWGPKFDYLTFAREIESVARADERKRVAKWVAQQRNGVPATGAEFAAAIRAL